MIGWGSILYGAALSGVAAAVLLFACGVRRPTSLLSAAATALASPIGWNAVLRATHAREFFTDAPIAVFPVSWQDSGSGVVTIAVASVVLGMIVMRARPASEVARLAVLAGVAAFLVDIYLY